ncbi:MAG: DUF1365 domain-containing protein [Rhodobiaceae bacterium]|nr:DUF1365 domain-containing protein [Rhodobiaceae bacterium]MCC0056537.1 DUF1365 domain-containing protein [Rhodobiaceae bacterium]
MNGISAIYTGHVVHVRHRPRRHRLRYRVFSMLLDLDELPDLSRRLRLFGYNRRAVFSFRETDHGYGEAGRLRDWVADRLSASGVHMEDMRVSLLCYPRIFGYVFNPLTVYFCRNSQGDLKAILYEVSNTFRERHTYVIPVAGGDGKVLHACDKAHYVSPFLSMDCRYRFRIAPPGERVMISIDEEEGGESVLFASFAGAREPLSDAVLARRLFSHPLMTLKVIAAIHWEALRLWLKGVPIHRHHPASERVTSSPIKPDLKAIRHEPS